MSELFKPSRSWRERLIERGLMGCALLSVCVTAGLVLTLFVEASRFFMEVSLAQWLMDTQWTPLFKQKRFGIWPLVSGTMLISVIALLVAAPLGLAAAITMSELASARARAWLKPALEVLAGVPTIVYGFFALTVITPALQQVWPGLAGFNALGPGLIMGVMIMPMVSSLCEDALHAVPDELREGAWALGASFPSAIFRVVLPSARSGIAAAMTLAWARAVGETMIVSIAAGQQPRLGLDPSVPTQTMTAYIVQVSQGDTPADSMEYHTIFAVGASLFVMTLGMNMVGQRLARGASRRTR